MSQGENEAARLQEQAEQIKRAVALYSGQMHKSDDPGMVWVRFPQHAWDQISTALTNPEGADPGVR